MTHIWQSVRSGDWLSAARARGYSLILLAIAVVATAGWIAISDGLIDRNGKPLGTDFSNVYAAGELTWQGKPADAYNPALQHAAEKAAFGGREVPFFGWHYPPFFFAIAFLVAALPYAFGLALWLAASCAAYLAAIRAILPSGADLTFATLQAARPQRERQIQSSTRVNILASGPLIPTFAKVLAAKGCECWNRTTSPETLLIATAFPAVFVNIGHGQNGFLTAALLGGALQLLDRRPWIAGVLIGLLAYKQHHCCCRDDRGSGRDQLCDSGRGSLARLHRLHEFYANRRARTGRHRLGEDPVDLLRRAQLGRRHQDRLCDPDRARGDACRLACVAMAQ
jgi:hypothetical protein